MTDIAHAVDQEHAADAAQRNWQQWRYDYPGPPDETGLYLSGPHQRAVFLLLAAWAAWFDKEYEHTQIRLAAAREEQRRELEGKF